MTCLVSAKFLSDVYVYEFTSFNEPVVTLGSAILKIFNFNHFLMKKKCLEKTVRYVFNITKYKSYLFPLKKHKYVENFMKNLQI